MPTRTTKNVSRIATTTAAAVLLTCLLALPSKTRAAEAVTYLFPAPPTLPAFGPIQLAKGKGYFANAGLDVNYAVARGGVDVAKQVGAGNAPLRSTSSSLRASRSWPSVTTC